MGYPIIVFYCFHFAYPIKCTSNKTEIHFGKTNQNIFNSNIINTKLCYYYPIKRLQSNKSNGKGKASPTY